MTSNKSRAQSLLESYDDVITGMMTDMDRYAQQSGGYINRMHPDQYDAEGKRKPLLGEMSYGASKNRRKAHMAALYGKTTK